MHNATKKKNNFRQYYTAPSSASLTYRFEFSILFLNLNLLYYIILYKITVNKKAEKRLVRNIIHSVSGWF